MAQTQGVNILLYSCHALPFWEGGGTYPFLNWVPRAEDTVEWIPVPELKSLQLSLRGLQLEFPSRVDFLLVWNFGCSLIEPL